MYQKAIILMLLCIMTFPANAHANSFTRNYSVLSLQSKSIHSTISLLSFKGTTAHCLADIRSADLRTKITMYLQSSTGSTITSWSQTFSGAGSHTLSKQRAVPKGKYKNKVLFQVLNSSGKVIETITKTSALVSTK